MASNWLVLLLTIGAGLAAGAEEFDQDIALLGDGVVLSGGHERSGVGFVEARRAAHDRTGAISV